MRLLLNPYLSAALVVGLMLLACVIAFPGRRPVAVWRWRLAVAPLLVAAASLLVLRLPPFNDLANPEVWMVGLPLAVVGVVRGALIDFSVDHGRSGFRSDGTARGSI